MKSNEDWERMKKKKLKTDCLCFSFFLLHVTVKATTGREEKRGGNCSRALCLLDFPAAVFEPMRRQWRRCVEKTRRHCSRTQKPSSTVSGLPCNYCRFLGFYFAIFELYLIYFEILLFILHVKKDV